MAYIYSIDEAAELYHHGILGMRWGIRRYQNKDGTLTKAGEKRYAKYQKKLNKQAKKLTKTAGQMAKLQGAKELTDNITAEQKSEEFKKQHYDIDITKIKTDELSDAELNRVNTRLTAQENFDKHVSTYKEKKKSPVAKFIKELVKEPLKNIALTTFKEASFNAVNKAVGYDLMETRKNKNNSNDKDSNDNNGNNNGGNNKKKKKK